MGHKHSKEEILEAALDAAIEDGLSHLTFGRLAKRLGIHDRTVVYYFPTKNDLVTAVLMSMGLELQDTLQDAFAEPATDHLQLARAAWPFLAHRDADPIFALFFEANGMAATGLEPYRTLVPRLTEGWVEWASTFVKGAPKRRRAEAEAAIALLDGLLLLRHLVGARAADRAAATLGVR